MATIHYGLAGEGRGHAARAAAIIDHLSQRHQVVVHSFGQALELLVPRYRGTGVRVGEIPGLLLGYHDGAVSKLRTLKQSLPYVGRIPHETKQLARSMRSDGAKLVISDFEPLTARAAEQAGIPWASIDHQRLLWVCRLDGFGLKLRAQARFASWLLKRLYLSPQNQVVSGFYLPELRPNQTALRAGVLLRSELLSAESTEGSHLVAYLRRGCPANVMSALEASGASVRVYGLGSRPQSGALTFHETSTEEFVTSLASACGLITTAGNQLIGEAHYLGKPVLAFPEPGNFEQEINGRLLTQSGGGLAVHADDFSAGLIGEFLTQRRRYARAIDPSRVRGNEAILSWLDALVAKP